LKRQQLSCKKERAAAFSPPLPLLPTDPSFRDNPIKKQCRVLSRKIFSGPWEPTRVSRHPDGISKKLANTAEKANVPFRKFVAIV
jgi:hypothetical protein